MSDPPTLQNTHPVLSRAEPLSWAERDTPKEALHTARETFEQALDNAGLDAVEWEQQSIRGLPILQITTPPNLSSEPTLRHLIRQHGVEMHAMRPTENGESLQFEALIPPQFAAGAISEVHQSSGTPTSERVTVTGALRRAGIGVGDSVRMAARPNEIRLWPAESGTSVYRAGAPVPAAIEQPPTETMVKNVVRNLQDGAVSVNVMEDSARPLIRVQTTRSRLPPLHYALSNTPAYIVDAEYSHSSYEGTAGLALTVGVHHSFTRIEDGHGQEATPIRRKTKRSCMVTLTKALDAAGIITPARDKDANPRVAVFARPGELRIVPATRKEDPIGL